MIAAGRARARRGVGRQGLARAVAAAARARLRRRRPLRRARHRRVLRRVGRRTRARSREQHGWPLLEVDLRDDVRLRHPRRLARREARAVLGVRAVEAPRVQRGRDRRNGYDVLATGHNLDDEAAVLFGNVLRWETGYLGRQHPVLPAAPGFARKVKPLVRLGERELAAYCVLTGIDYIVEECPMAAGNRHLGYKEAAQRDRGALARARRPRSCSASSSAATTASRPTRPRSATTCSPCRECGAPTPGDVCAFCRLQRAGHRPIAAHGRDRSAAP